MNQFNTVIQAKGHSDKEGSWMGAKQVIRHF